MRAEAEIRTGISVLLVVQLVMAFGAMGLLTRMGPAIERIISENVTSIQAAEEMYATLAMHDCAPVLGHADIDSRIRFDAGLQAAKRAAHLPEEQVAIGQIERDWEAAIDGDCRARDSTASALGDLASINRNLMGLADAQTKRLGAAGAWATVLLGLAAFGASIGLIRRFGRRLAEPLQEVEAVLTAVGAGDPYRRCKRMEAPSEYGVIAVRLNQLLDRRLAKQETEDPELRRIDRTLLHHLLDGRTQPTVAVDASGAILVASQSALDLLEKSGIEAIADVLARGVDGSDEDSIIAGVEPFGRPDGFLITLHPAGSPETGGEPKVSLLDESSESPRPVIRNALADRGASDSKELPKRVEEKSDKPDWERD